MPYLRLFYARLRLILLEPVAFFRGQAISMTLSEALAMGLLCHWIGFALQSVWNEIFGVILSDAFKGFHFPTGSFSDIDGAARQIPFLNNIFSGLRSGLSSAFLSAGWVFLDPFKILVFTCIKSLVFFAMARLLIAESERPRWVTIETVLKLTSIALVPSIFSFIPFFGGLISSIGGVYLLVLGFKEYFMISTSRALLVTFFPWLLMAGILMIGLISAGVFALSFFF